MNHPSIHNGNSKILVVLRGALGDVLLTRPVLKALPDLFQAEAVTLVGNPVFLQLLANQPFVSGIEDHNRADWAGLYQDEPRVSDRFRSFILGHRAGVVAARRRPDPGAGGLVKTGLNPVITIPARPPEDRRIHLVEHMAGALGIKLGAEHIPIKPEPEELAKARDFFKNSSLDPRRCLALHPGSGGARKNWPLDNWIELAKAARKKWNLNCLIVLGPAEEQLHPGIGGLFENAGLTTVRRTALPALAGILSQVRGFLGHDSGITHLAAGLGTATTALFGPTDPAHWRPLGPRVNILAPPAGPENSWNWLKRTQIIDIIGKIIKIE